MHKSSSLVGGQLLDIEGASTIGNVRGLKKDSGGGLVKRTSLAKREC